MKIVVTGGAGFIGSNLVRALAEERLARSVVVVDDLSTGSLENLVGAEGVDVRIGSILDPDLLDEAFSDVSCVVHLAALPSVPRSIADPMSSHHANATGTLHVLEAARRSGRPHVIVASSSSVYGASKEIPKTERLAQLPLSPYAASKLATEAYALAYGSSFEMDVLAFRFFNVFGPMQSAGHAYAAVIPSFVDRALHSEPLTVHGDGHQTRDFTCVGSVVRVLCSAIERRVTCRMPVNLAFGSRISLLELIGALEEIVDHHLEREFVLPRAGDVRDSQADCSLLRGLFPDIEPVSLHDGLEMAVEWYAGELERLDHMTSVES